MCTLGLWWRATTMPVFVLVRRDREHQHPRPLDTDSLEDLATRAVAEENRFPVQLRVADLLAVRVHDRVGNPRTAQRAGEVFSFNRSRR
jgi:hypothetical protein